MKQSKLILSIAAVILLAVIWQLSMSVTSAEPLSEAEAKKLIQDMYSGKVIEVNKVNDTYKITIELDTGVYDVTINRVTKDIGGITRTNVPEQTAHEWTEAEIKELVLQQQKGEIEKIAKKVEAEQTFYYAVVEHGTNETTFKVNASTGEIVHTETKEIEQPSIQSVQRITKEDAIKLAKKNVSGEVDDVEVEQSGGLTYYLVEIERENDQEATVQINAVTGEVMSTTWDLD